MDSRVADGLRIIAFGAAFFIVGLVGLTVVASVSADHSADPDLGSFSSALAINDLIVTLFAASVMLIGIGAMAWGSLVVTTYANKQ